MVYSNKFQFSFLEKLCYAFYQSKASDFLITKRHHVLIVKFSWVFFFKSELSMCNVNLLKDELHNVMGRNTIGGVEKPQFHLSSIVSSSSRPVFPHQLSCRASLNVSSLFVHCSASSGLWKYRFLDPPHSAYRSGVGKLWPIRHIWPTAYFLYSPQTRMVFRIF